MSSGMTQINDNFREAAGSGVNLKQCTMRYCPDTQDQILEFEVDGAHGPQKHVERIPRGEDTRALVAGAIRAGVRAREGRTQVDPVPVEEVFF